MLVHFLTDEPTKFPAIRASLEPRHQVVTGLLGDSGAQIEPHGVLVVDVDLRQARRIEQVRRVLQPLSGSCHKWFVVHNQACSMVAQAHALGATAVISSTKEIVFKLAHIEEAQKAGQRDLAVPSALTDCAAAFASMFLAVRAGKPISLSDATRATSEIIDRVQRSGLTFFSTRCAAITKVRSSIACWSPAWPWGLESRSDFPALDVSRLGIAATLHDIGKACIPLSILDKPGSLDASETRS